MTKKRRTKKKKVKKNPFWFYVLAVLILFSSSTGVSYLYFAPMLAFEAPFIENIETRQDDIVSEDTRTAPERLYTSHRQVLSEGTEQARGVLLIKAEDIIRNYVKPLNTGLLDLYMDREGTIYANFSRDLKNNFHGDANEEYEIIAGLYRQLKSSIPGFLWLKILIEGREEESFGGHINISGPIGEGIEGVSQRKIDRYF